MTDPAASDDDHAIAARVDELRREVERLEAELGDHSARRQAVFDMAQRLKRERLRLPRGQGPATDTTVAVRLLIEGGAQVLVIAGAMALDRALGSAAIGLAFVVLVFQSVGLFEGGVDAKPPR